MRTDPEAFARQGSTEARKRQHPRKLRGWIPQHRRPRRLGVGVAQREPAWVPQSFFNEPSAFGSDASAGHREPADLVEAGQLAASLAQHAAALVIQKYRDAGLTVRELAERVGQSEGYLSGQLTGRYPAGYDDLVRWAVALNDVSVLPIVETLKTFTPPGFDR